MHFETLFFSIVAIGVPLPMCNLLLWIALCIKKNLFLWGVISMDMKWRRPTGPHWVEPHIPRNKSNNERKNYFIAVILKLLKSEDHSDLEIPLTTSSLQSTHFPFVGTEAQRDSIFKDRQKPRYSVRRLDLGPKSPVSTFNVFFVTSISNSNNNIMWLEILFIKLKMSKRKPTLCQSHS